MESLPGLFIESCRRFSDRPLWLTRDGNDFHTTTYAEAERRVAALAEELARCGIVQGDRVAIMAENSVRWAILDWAILSLGAITVPIYPTLPAKDAGAILNDSGAKIAFGDGPKLVETLRAAGSSAQILAFDSLHWNAEPENLGEWRARAGSVSEEDVATLIYTSGTTGEPKGAVLLHRAFGFLCQAIQSQLPVGPEDRFVSFLPLSHVYERMAGHFLPVACGASIAYARSLKTLAEDIRMAQPTILLTVPRFLESVKSKIEASVPPGWKRRLFEATVRMGKQRLANRLRPVGIKGALLDVLVAKKVRDRLGGRIRFLVSGGAALPAELAEFYGAFGILILQGYGLTETAPVISVNHPDRSVYQSAGEVLEGIEVKIADDGEILMRGPSLMVGYYNNPSATAQAIDSEGWFHTGDIGYLEGRRIYITDRKKDMIVLANGKNVAPAKIEGILKSQPSIGECMVVGDGSDHISALILPRWEVLAPELRSQGLNPSMREEAVKSEWLQERVRRDVQAANAQLADFEKVKKYRLIPDDWTIEGGELTPSMKVKRPVIRERYRDWIEEVR
jgi:long-chain acyl-CoA synthetase